MSTGATGRCEHEAVSEFASGTALGLWECDDCGQMLRGPYGAETLTPVQMVESGAMIAEAADVAMLRRIEGAVRQGLRLQAILQQRFGYVDEFGIPLQPDDLARLAALIERGGTG